MSAIVTFCGTGSMNGAIASGLISGGYDSSSVRVTVYSQHSAQRLSSAWGVDGSEGIRVFSVAEDSQANLRAVTGAQVVILGVKPYAILDMAREIAPALASDALVISVAAGVSLESLSAVLPVGQPVIRCMPNTPSQVGCGVLAISCGDSVSDQQRELTLKILGSVGKVFEVAENQMDAVTAVSGSGPAYFFLLAEMMMKAGMKLGLDAELAEQLAVQTARGAGELLGAQGDPVALRRAVTSPGGTTEQAIESFCQNGLEEMTEQAMRACAQKSAQMTRDYS
ncbi:pyrroline-5-carboxylate reductase [Rothia sp. CCM 9418]|uniref:pyrroline-5-carboxylate reductase n=1 Tax=Rothia sp. CCM 9418 TaxID=3402661 RepID=UPI003AE918C8